MSRSDGRRLAVLEALDEREWRSVWTVATRGGLKIAGTRSKLKTLVSAGMAERRKVLSFGRWISEYRRTPAGSAELGRMKRVMPSAPRRPDYVPPAR